MSRTISTEVVGSYRLSDFTTGTVVKLALSLEMICLSAGLVASTQTGTLFPWIQMTTLVGVMIAFLTYVWTGRTVTVLCLLLVVSVWYRVVQFVLPPSIVGLDPRGYAIWIQQIVEAGGTETFSVWFYGSAPLYVVYNAMVSVLTATPVSVSMGVGAIIFGVFPPLVAFCLARSISPNRTETAGLVAASFVAVAVVSVKTGYWPIAQLLGTVFWLVFVVGLWRYAVSGKRRDAAILYLALVGMLYSHKLPLLPATGAVLALLTFETVARSRSSGARRIKTPLKGLLVVALLCVVLTLFQWNFVTQLTAAIALDINSLLTGSLSTDDVTVISTPEATPAHAPIMGILVRKASMIVVLPFAGAAWVLLVVQQWESVSTRAVLAISAAPTSLFALYLLSPGMITFGRIFMITDTLFAILLGVAIALLSRRTAVGKAFTIVVVLLVLFQFVTTPVAPDHPSGPRYYLSEGEIDAHAFATTTYPGPIATDNYFAGTVRDPTRRVNNDGRIIVPVGSHFDGVNQLYLNGTIATANHTYVAHRTRKQFYRAKGIWRLTWRPSVALDKRYHRTYDNSEVRLYAASN